MSEEFEEELSFSRRSLIIGAAQLGLFGVLIGRLQYLQIAQSETYATLADANRVNISSVIASRGLISDRYGISLAENDRNLSVVIVPERAVDLAATLGELQRILDLSDGHVRRVKNRVRRLPKFKAITVADNLRWEQFAKLNSQLPFLPGVEPVVGEKRVYTYGAAAAHLIGYVGAKTAKDIDQFGDIANDTVGQTSIERSHEEALRGLAGLRQVEVNALGRPVRELSQSPAESGQNLQLTIDVELQKFASERLGKQSGSVVVMDVNNGDILCMVSTPSYDPNQLSSGIDSKSWEAMLVHERKPLLNKPLRGLYAPGSTFKMIVALAALEAGVITPNERIKCSGIHNYANEQYHCWLDEGHGDITLEAALAQSCDVYFYDIAVRTGIDNIEKMARRFGLGQATGIDLSGEKTGIVPGRDWKRANFDAGWRGGETVITGIGQGFLLATPLQLVVMTAALANKGVYVRPRVSVPAAGDAANSDEASKVDLQLPSRHLALVQSGMYQAVNTADGTAYGSSLLINGQRMVGKTGTSQVRRITLAERETGVVANKDLEWYLRDHALFVGYAPFKNPRYAISVVVEHGGGGAAVAAPIARDIMAQLLSMPARKAKQVTA